ncbi:hypothetical protein ACFL6Y_09885 [Elusimicrobiota bacterium]
MMSRLSIAAIVFGVLFCAGYAGAVEKLNIKQVGDVFLGAERLHDGKGSLPTLVLPLQGGGKKKGNGSFNRFIEKIRTELSNDPEVVVRREAQRDPYISACINDPDIPIGSEADVKYMKKEYCGEGYRGYGGPVHYHLIKESDVVVLRMAIYFIYKGKERNRESTKKEVEGTLRYITAFFGRHGIKLELESIFDTGVYEDRRRADSFITLADSSHHVSARHWTTYSPIAVHEFGHILGLSDEYPSGMCPARKVGMEDDSVMKYWHVERPRLYPRHIEQLLGPLCG